MRVDALSDLCLQGHRTDFVVCKLHFTAFATPQSPSESGILPLKGPDGIALRNLVDHNVETTSPAWEHDNFNPAILTTSVNRLDENPYQSQNPTYTEYVSLQDLELQNPYSDITAGPADIHQSSTDTNGLYTTERNSWTKEAAHLYYPFNRETSHSEDEPNCDSGTFPAQSSARRNKYIKDWFYRNKSIPYPSRSQIIELSTLSGLSIRQVQICLRNLRARSGSSMLLHVCLATKAELRIRTGSSNRATPQITAEEVPAGDPPKGFWQESDNNEEILLSHCHNFTSLEGETSQSTMDPYQSFIDPGDEGSFAIVDPALNLPSSFQSHNDISQEHPPNDLDCQTTMAPKRKGRRRHLPRSFESPYGQAKGLSPPMSSDSGSDTRKNFPCTACPKSFIDVYNWKRHESGVHGHNDVAWTCMLDGMLKDEMKCIFCLESVDDIEHFNRHDIEACAAKNETERTFPRKDLLKQHVKNSHLVLANEYIKRGFKVPEFWSSKVDPSAQKSDALWCGICQYMFEAIPTRMEHVAQHFANGEGLVSWVPRRST